MSWEVKTGDCVELMKAMEPDSFHALVTDPPYGLEFMGKEWDALGASRAKRGTLDNMKNPDGSQKFKTRAPAFDLSEAGRSAMQGWHYSWAVEALRVCKPGAHLIAFGGTRTYHRLACAIEDAGWEIRDCLMFLYGSGFPKSLDVSKAIDKMQGNERERVPGGCGSSNTASLGTFKPGEAISVEAIEWQGFGTALKPAYEPIILARKPLEGTVAQNVLKHGCGALDIDGSRIGWKSEADAAAAAVGFRTSQSTGRIDAKTYGQIKTDNVPAYDNTVPGRWPSNVLLDQEAAVLLDAQAGDCGGSGKASGPTLGKMGTNVCYGSANGENMGEPCFYGDSGGASRFFYTSKASQEERPEVDGIQHPTVKPLDLMRYLVGLVSREGDMVLEPFAGSGTTLAACVGLGRNVVACELNPSYVELINKRMQTVTPSLFGGQ